MSHPLQNYRRLQREARAQFDPFTKLHCPTCQTPCCVRPARIIPTDIALAEAHGWRARVAAVAGADAAQRAAADQAMALCGEVDALPHEPCEHLSADGCSFPPDLRPFGCAAYICPVMREKMDRKALSRLKRKVKELTLAHEVLTAALQRSGRATER
jgi:hypothetical protein